VGALALSWFPYIDPCGVMVWFSKEGQAHLNINFAVNQCMKRLIAFIIK